MDVVLWFKVWVWGKLGPKMYLTDLKMSNIPIFELDTVIHACF